MSRRRRLNTNISTSSDQTEEVDERQRIAVFTQNWMESTLLAHGLPNCCLKSWLAGQVIFHWEDIERLLSLNAPIRVFVEDAN